MESPHSLDLRSRLDDRIAAWRVTVERFAETESSALAFGHREGQPMVLKVVKAPGDEWRSGEILAAFEGRGVVRAYEHVPGGMLLERLSPGRSLAALALSGADEKATRVLTETIRTMAPRIPTGTLPTARDWGKGFDRYLSSGDAQIPKHLLSAAHRVYSELCSSQTRVRLLHGDLHHYNVLFDAGRGWIAIDPKGVLGELEYEVGAALRNPYEAPELFADPPVILSRVDCFARELGVEPSRVLGWAFSQAVLAALWAIEDGLPVEPGNGWLALATALQPMLGSPAGAR